MILQLTNKQTGLEADDMIDNTQAFINLIFTDVQNRPTTLSNNACYKGSTTNIAVPNFVRQNPFLELFWLYDISYQADQRIQTFQPVVLTSNTGEPFYQLPVYRFLNSSVV